MIDRYQKNQMQKNFKAGLTVTSTTNQFGLPIILETDETEAKEGENLPVSNKLTAIVIKDQEVPKISEVSESEEEEDV